MAHFARVENGIIQTVIAVSNEALGGLDFPESEPVGQEFIASIGLTGDWVQCSYSGSFRGVYPGPGWAYDGTTFAEPVSPEAAAYARGKADGVAEATLSANADPLA